MSENFLGGIARHRETTQWAEIMNNTDINPHILRSKLWFFPWIIMVPVTFLFPHNISRAQRLDVDRRVSLENFWLGKIGEREVDHRRLAREYLLTWTKTQDESIVPDSDMRLAYKRNLAFYIRPAKRGVSHILVQDLSTPDDKTSPEAKLVADEVLRRARRRRSEHPLTAEDFDILLKEISAPAIEDQKVEASALQVFRYDHEKIGIKQETFATAREKDTVEPFAKAAFALPQVGDVSQVVETSFGYHIIIYLSDVPAANKSFEAAKPDLAKRLLNVSRQAAYSALLKKLRKKYRVVSPTGI